MKANVEPLKRQHRDTLFRGWFKIPENFLQILAYCRHKT